MNQSIMYILYAPLEDLRLIATHATQKKEEKKYELDKKI